MRGFTSLRNYSARLPPQFIGAATRLQHRCPGPMTVSPTCPASQCAYGSLI
ncbi:hypothetical protein STANM309S_03181 [Streptomyces tanashiensis]